MPPLVAPDFPAALSAGDTWAWTVPVYPAMTQGAALTYFFGAALLSVTGQLAADGLSFAFVALSTETAKLSPSILPFAAYLTLAGARSTFRNGQLRVLPNLADSNAVITTALGIELAAVQKTLGSIRRRSNGSFSSGDGVSYTVAQIAALKADEADLRRRVAAEQGKSGSVKIRTGFGSPCLLPAFRRGY